jgi:uncharacterized protein (TIGR01777 family)
MDKRQTKRILIAGGSGTVGQKLTISLQNKGFDVAWLSRSTGSKNNVRTFYWNPATNNIDNQALEFADVIINLAGTGVADARWSSAYKSAIYDSRIDSTNLIANALTQGKHSTKSYLSASAIGIYGYNAGLNTPETGPFANNFLANVCHDWENAAAPIEKLGIQTVFLRIGVVLAKEGGFVKEVSAPIKRYVGAVLGNGQQQTSWIHIDDLCNLFIHFINNPNLNGAFNAVSPNPETNANLTRMMAKLLGKPLWLPGVPKFVLRLLFGELSDVLLASQHISAQKVLDTGFTFAFPKAEAALKDLIPE